MIQESLSITSSESEQRAVWGSWGVCKEMSWWMKDTCPEQTFSRTEAPYSGNRRQKGWCVHRRPIQAFKGDCLSRSVSQATDWTPLWPDLESQAVRTSVSWSCQAWLVGDGRLAPFHSRSSVHSQILLRCSDPPTGWSGKFIVFFSFLFENFMHEYTVLTSFPPLLRALCAPIYF